MATFFKAANVQDLEEGKGVRSDIHGKQIAIFKIEGKIYAIGNICPHRGGPLAEGECSEGKVTCPWHAWQFDLETGLNPENPAVKVPVYPIKMEGNEIWVEISS